MKQYSIFKHFTSGVCFPSAKKLVIIIIGMVIILCCLMTKPRAKPHCNSFKNDCTCKPLSQHYALNLRPRKYSLPLNELENKDYKKLIDLKDFAFKINQPNKCSDSSVFLLMVISSSAANQERRNVIRETWGKEDGKVKTVFLLGQVTDEHVQTTIESESDQYRDIVQGNFLDTYKNLTYKTIMALKYAVYHCSNAIYVLKLDDDVFINTPMLRNYLKNDLSPFGAQSLLQCIVYKNKAPMRLIFSKWYVSQQDYAFTIYPTYCQGPFALISPDIVFKLYKEAQKTPYFVFEDVFTYGMAGSKVNGLIHSDIGHLTLVDYDCSELLRNRFINVNFLLGPLEMGIVEVKKLWKLIVERPVPSSVYDYTSWDD